MVKTRVNEKLGNLHRKWFDNMISGKGYSFGKTDFSLIHKTYTVDGMGNLSDVTESTSTISGDLQYVTKEDKDLLELGWVKVGDGIFYTSSLNVVVENDELSVDSVRWKLTRKVEGPTVGSAEMHQSWVATRVEM